MAAAAASITSAAEWAASKAQFISAAEATTASAAVVAAELASTATQLSTSQQANTTATITIQTLESTILASKAKAAKLATELSILQTNSTEVRRSGFGHKFALEDAIEFHTFAPLEALSCV
jgi:hypothetical protein